MGYGLGIFLLVLGLILALAVQDMLEAVDLTVVGWILALAGVVVIVLTAVQLNARRRNTTVSRTTHADGSQTVREDRKDQDPPPPAV